MKHTPVIGVTISLFGIVSAASAAEADIVTTTTNNAFFIPFWFIAVLGALAIFTIALSLTQPPAAGLPISILGAFLAVAALFSSFTGGTMGEIQTITNQTISETIGNITTVTSTAQTIAPIILYQHPGILLIFGGIAAFAFIVLIGRIFAFMTYTANQAAKTKEF